MEASLSLATSASGTAPLRSRFRRQLAVADGRNSAAARSPSSCAEPTSPPVSGYGIRKTALNTGAVDE